MSTIDEIEKLYTDNMHKYGKSSPSVGWPDNDKHILRFDMLLRDVPLQAIETVNDLGAGYGAILDYLSTKRHNLKKYYAYDISSVMLESIDDKKFNQTEIVRKHSSVLDTKADMTIASGIFNVRFEESDALWTDFIIKTLNNMYDNSEKYFSFNLLTKYVDFRRDNLFYGDPCFFFDYCKQKFSKYVTLYHDYELFEWTILVKKNGSK